MQPATLDYITATAIEERAGESNHQSAINTRELTDHSNVEKFRQPEDKSAYDKDRFTAMIVTRDPINFKNSDAKLRADAVRNESTEEITVTQVNSSAISKWSEANKKLIKIMAQLRTKKPESVANLRANPIEGRDFPEEQQSTTTLGAAIPEMGGDNIDPDTEQINAIQKQEEISQVYNSENIVRKYSELYLDLSCDLKGSSQRLFLPQTKTRTDTMSRIECGEFVEEVPICRRVCNLSTAEDESAAFLEVPLRDVSKTACSQDVPREDNSVQLSKNLASSLKMECSSEVVFKPSHHPAHMGENMFFTQYSFWDPGIVVIKMLSRISPMVSMDSEELNELAWEQADWYSMDVEDYWGGNMDVAHMLGKND